MTFRDRGDGYCARCGRVIGWHAGDRCYPAESSGMPAPITGRFIDTTDPAGPIARMREELAATGPATFKPAELEELADELELEESGQIRLGSDGEQRAFQGLALELEPAPFLFSPDHHEEA